MFFKGLSFYAVETMKKVLEESESWFMAQEVDREDQGDHQTHLHHKGIRWKRPPGEWLKCNIGCSWNKKKKLGGGSWVLRDNKVVVLHSRKAFEFLVLEDDFKFAVFVWAVECMRNHNVEKVIFASQDNKLVGVVLRPSAWPNFKFHSAVLYKVLNHFLEWRLEIETGGANRGTVLIAQSVINEERLQSYMSIGYPFWLRNLFFEEARDV